MGRMRRRIVRETVKVSVGWVQILYREIFLVRILLWGGCICMCVVCCADRVQIPCLGKNVWFKFVCVYCAYGVQITGNICGSNLNPI